MNETNDDRRATGDDVRDSIEIQVNGKPREVPRGSTVHQLLRMLDLAPATIVVERNLEILDRADYGDTVLEEGDRLELVHFVGGG